MVWNLNAAAAKMIDHKRNYNWTYWSETTISIVPSKTAAQSLSCTVKERASTEIDKYRTIFIYQT